MEKKIRIVTVKRLMTYYKIKHGVINYFGDTKDAFKGYCERFYHRMTRPSPKKFVRDYMRTNGRVTKK
jgi:hypothetical protein